MTKVDCPGCSKKMTRGATLCVRCRKRAIRIGVRAVLEQKTRAPEPPPGEERIAAKQRGAFFAKGRDIAQMVGVDEDTIHDEYLAIAAERFRRDITSVNHLSYLEAGEILDEMRDRIRAGKAAYALPELA